MSEPYSHCWCFLRIFPADISSGENIFSQLEIIRTIRLVPNILFRPLTPRVRCRLGAHQSNMNCYDLIKFSYKFSLNQMQLQLGKDSGQMIQLEKITQNVINTFN